MAIKKESGQDGSTRKLPDQPDVRTDPGSKEEREVSFARRALIQAGWVAPVVMAVQLPAHAQASPRHDDHSDHNDAAHNDAPHSDHADAGAHNDHADAAHNDTPHDDIAHQDTLTNRPIHDDHVDGGHADHNDLLAHQDVEHVDVPHGDG